MKCPSRSWIACTGRASWEATRSSRTPRGSWRSSDQFRAQAVDTFCNSCTIWVVFAFHPRRSCRARDQKPLGHVEAIPVRLEVHKRLARRSTSIHLLPIPIDVNRDRSQEAMIRRDPHDPHDLRGGLDRHSLIAVRADHQWERGDGGRERTSGSSARDTGS